MHEISALHEAVKLAEQTARENGIERLSSITLEVGELSGFLPVFFRQYFPVVVENRPVFEGCELNILIARGEALCLDCHAIYNVMANEGRCPKCSSRFKKILGGQEFILREIAYE